MDSKETDEEYHYRDPSYDGGHDTGCELHPRLVGDVHDLFEVKVPVVFAEAMLEGNCET